VELDSKFLGRGVVVTSDVGVEMDRFLVQVRSPPPQLSVRCEPYTSYARVAQVIEKKSGDTLAANDLVVIPVEDQHIQPTE
jgi:hypothetical protein